MFRCVFETKSGVKGDFLKGTFRECVDELNAETVEYREIEIKKEGDEECLMKSSEKR